MPSKAPFLVALRGLDPYKRYLTRLEAAVKKSGVQIDGPHALAEYALAVLGLQHGLRAPARMPPMGRPKTQSKPKARP